jgi:hypothetical protein
VGIVAGGLIGGAFMAAAAWRIRPRLGWVLALALAFAWWLAYLVANLPPRFGLKSGPYYLLKPESLMLWAVCGLAGGLVTALTLRKANGSSDRKEIALSGVGWAAAWFLGILGGTGFAEGNLGRPSPLLLIFTSNFALQGLVAGILGGILTAILFGRETIAPSRESAETRQTASRPFELNLTNPLWAVALSGIGWAVAGAIAAPSMIGHVPDWPTALVTGLLGGTATIAGLRLVARDLDLIRMLLSVAAWGVSVSTIAFIDTATWLAVPVGLLGGGLVTGYALQQWNESAEWKQIAMVTGGWALAWIIALFLALVAFRDASSQIVAWFALSGVIGSSLTLLTLRRMVSQTGWSHPRVE